MIVLKIEKTFDNPKSPKSLWTDKNNHFYCKFMHFLTYPPKV